MIFIIVLGGEVWPLVPKLETFLHIISRVQWVQFTNEHNQECTLRSSRVQIYNVGNVSSNVGQTWCIVSNIILLTPKLVQGKICIVDKSPRNCSNTPSHIKEHFSQVIWKQGCRDRAEWWASSIWSVTVLSLFKEKDSFVIWCNISNIVVKVCLHIFPKPWYIDNTKKTHSQRNVLMHHAWMKEMNNLFGKWDGSHIPIYLFIPYIHRNPNFYLRVSFESFYFILM